MGADMVDASPLITSRLVISSFEELRAIESFGLTGSWGWTFATNTQVWSPGFYRILGLDEARFPPSYELFRSLVHPDDQPEIASAAQLVQDGIVRDSIVRVIRPDRTLRILHSRCEIYFTPDGRPRGAAGLVLDVTDREQLARAQTAERRR